MIKISLKNLASFTLAALSITTYASAANDVDAGSAPKNGVLVGGALMYPNKNIIENITKANDETTFVTAVKAAGLVETFQGNGPFTVFVPTNEAFAKLSSGTVDTLLKPENKAKLAALLTYHVIADKLNVHDLMEKLNQGGGQVKLKTVEGDDILVRLLNGKIVLEDSKGNRSNILIADVFQSNGVLHIVDTVLLP